MKVMAPLVAMLAALALALVPATVLAAESLPDDPTNRTEGNNPSITQKVLGLDAWVRSNGRMPDVLVLGSSRSVMIDPQQIYRLTGMRAFNAGISSGAARELLAMSSYADLRSGGHPPRVVVLLDLEAFDNRRPTTRVVDYQRRLDAAADACDGARLCMLRAARQLALDAIARQRSAVRDYHETQRTDGRQINGVLAKLEAQGVDLARYREQRIRIRIGSYRVGGFDRIYPAPREAFERMLTLLNERGVEPVIAITSMHPDCIRRCGPAGWAARRQEVRAMLDELQATHDFRLIDLSYPTTWNGSGASFYDEIHLRPLAAAKVVRRLIRFGAFEDA
jgi:hypothetical protein